MSVSDGMVDKTFLSRRGFALTSVAACGCCAMPAIAQNRIVSCGISDAAMHSLAASGTLVGVDQIRLDRNFALPGASTSGDQAFDRLLGETLAEIASTLGAFPYFSFYDDRHLPDGHDTKGGAFASRLRLEGGDGTVVYGLSLAAKARQRNGADDAMIAICAHEFGHILGFKLGLETELRRHGLPSSAFELHADYLAGYYTQRHLAARGGGTTGISGFWSGLGSVSHGSPLQRRDSFEAGYRYGAINLSARGDQAFHGGLDFLRGYQFG